MVTPAVGTVVLVPKMQPTQKLLELLGQRIAEDLRHQETAETPNEIAAGTS